MQEPSSTSPDIDFSNAVILANLFLLQSESSSHPAYDEDPYDSEHGPCLAPV